VQRLEVALPGVASSVPPARHFVERTLEAWGLPDLGWAGALVVSELAANAALHAGTSFTVVVEQRGDQVRVGVQDGSSRLPRARRHGVEATTGRGLRLVETLGQSWGVEELPTGKTVWCDLATAPAGGAGDDQGDLDAVLRMFPGDVEVSEPAGPSVVCAWPVAA
jgi:anti-sigma regulatory factor (Ser/Thr protein kinase)